LKTKRSSSSTRITNRESDDKMRKHQKKRNSLLLYEFLVHTISRALVEDEKQKSSTALKILRKYFKPGTEIYKEFRLMHALMKTTVSSEHVAASILSEAKNAVIAFDSEKLDREKSLLIKNINHMINDENFYDQHVSEYRELATIQMLINEWSASTKDLLSQAQYEDQVMKYLTTVKKPVEDSVISEDSSGTARLLMKVMSKKLNEKYADVLNEQQKSLIKAYTYSTASEDQTSIRLKLEEIKESVMTLIDSYSQAMKPASAGMNSCEYLREKLDETKAALTVENFDNIDDEMVTRFMLYSNLKDELESTE